MLIYLIGLAILSLLIFVLTVLTFKTKNLLYRSLGVFLFLLLIPFITINNAKLLGNPRSLPLNIISFENFEKLEVRDYVIGKNKEVYLFLLEKDKEKPIYMVLTDVPDEKKQEMAEKTQKAEQAGKKLYIELKSNSLSYIKEKINQTNKPYSGLTEKYEFVVEDTRDYPVNDDLKKQSPPIIVEEERNNREDSEGDPGGSF